jgi:hypothetical protein
MKQYVIQLVAGLIGLGMLVYGEYKDYRKNHPVVMTTEQLSDHQLKSVRYYLYHIAYDPNNDKIWYYYTDGKWYDQPPQIRERYDQDQKALGTPTGPQYAPERERIARFPSTTNPYTLR